MQMSSHVEAISQHMAIHTQDFSLSISLGNEVLRMCCQMVYLIYSLIIMLFYCYFRDPEGTSMCLGQ